jgi:hypothetical protein
MNSPNDGSTLLYVHDGLPIVELSTLVIPGFPYTWWLMKNFQNLQLDHYVRDMIPRLNIAWVYVDSWAPIIGAWGRAGQLDRRRADDAGARFDQPGRHTGADPGAHRLRLRLS